MFKYTIPLLCISLNESDSKLYIDFGFCEGKNHKHLKNILIYKANHLMLTFFFEKSLHILENESSSVLVDILNT